MSNDQKRVTIGTGDKFYVITLGISIQDTRNPEVHPIHRHEVYGVATTSEVAEQLVRESIGRTGLRKTNYDTRLGISEFKVWHGRREHTPGIVEEFEWIARLVEVDTYVL